MSRFWCPWILGCAIVFFNMAAYSGGNERMEAIDPHVWNYETVTNSLYDSYKKREKGIPEIITVLETALTQPDDATNLSIVGNAVYYLHQLVLEGYKTKAIGCVLIKTINQQSDLVATLDTAEALRDVTGIDVAYSKEFVDNFDADSKDDLEAKRKKIQTWALDLDCPM